MWHPPSREAAAEFSPGREPRVGKSLKNQPRRGGTPFPGDGWRIGTVGVSPLRGWGGFWGTRPGVGTPG